MFGSLNTFFLGGMESPRSRSRSCGIRSHQVRNLCNWSTNWSERRVLKISHKLFRKCYITSLQYGASKNFLTSFSTKSDHSSTSRGSTSAPGQLPVDRLKQKPSLQNRVGQSASPTTVKKQHSNGKVALPPLKRSITPLKP